MIPDWLILESCLVSNCSCFKIDTLLADQDGPTGWLQVAKKLESNASLNMYRKFSQLHIRMFLSRQSSINELEKQLRDLDHGDLADNVWRSRSLDHEENWKITKQELLKKIEAELHTYSMSTMRTLFIL